MMMIHLQLIRCSKALFHLSISAWLNWSLSQLLAKSPTTIIIMMKITKMMRILKIVVVVIRQLLFRFKWSPFNFPRVTNKGFSYLTLSY